MWIIHSASLPAKYGAAAPPINHKKLYAADAVALSTGAACITAVVINVLLLPKNAPAIMTQMIITSFVSVPIPIMISVRANSVNIAYIDLSVPNFY
jgi:hypothetical protein